MRRTLSPDRRFAIAQHAAAHRAAPTFSELALWQQLSGSKLGVGFRRQYPVGQFIADFAAPSVKLVVEVDGGYHGLSQVVRADARRDSVMARLGWRVVRVSAEQVLGDVAGVVAVIRAALAACP